MESTLKRTWAEIDLDHLTHNFEVIRRHVGDKVKPVSYTHLRAHET